jgi:tetratricopeptide (TPR) repeat protein
MRADDRDMEDSHLDGFIMPDGEFIPIDDTQRMYEAAEKHLQTPRKIIDLMHELAIDCVSKNKLAVAQAYFERIIAISDSEVIKSLSLLSIGQIKENQEDIPGAIEWYRRAFRMRPGSDGTWYLLYNNLGYCLNRLGQHEEAMGYCEKAVSLNPDRHNAHKNLGVALEGLCRYSDAARSYLRAAGLCPADTRALSLLYSVIKSHPEIAVDFPELRNGTNLAVLGPSLPMSGQEN